MTNTVLREEYEKIKADMLAKAHHIDPSDNISLTFVEDETISVKVDVGLSSFMPSCEALLTSKRIEAMNALVSTFPYQGYTLAD